MNRRTRCTDHCIRDNDIICRLLPGDSAMRCRCTSCALGKSRARASTSSRGLLLMLDDGELALLLLLLLLLSPPLALLSEERLRVGIFVVYSPRIWHERTNGPSMASPPTALAMPPPPGASGPEDFDARTNVTLTASVAYMPQSVSRRHWSASVLTCTYTCVVHMGLGQLGGWRPFVHMHCGLHTSPTATNPRHT